MLEINKELCLSTSHIEDLTYNKVIQNLVDDCLLCGFSYKEGWRILTPTDTEMGLFLKDPTFPRSLYKLLLLSITNGCKWLVLDRDSPVCDLLETFDW